MHSEGADVDQSAAGRLAGEAIRAPASFLGPGVNWQPSSQPNTVTAVRRIGRHAVSTDLLVSERGALRSVTIRRWGNRAKQPWGEYPFGGKVEQEATFDGFTIASVLAVGWFFGTDQAANGEFFRLRITHAHYL